LYGAEGVRAGAFLAFPSAELYENYYSNVFAAPTNEVSDSATQLNFSLGVESNWSTHRLNASIGTVSRFFQDVSEQDSTDVTAALSGRLDMSRQTYFTVDLAAAGLNESIADSPTGQNLAKPVEYDRRGAGVGYSHALNRVRFSGSARVEKYDFDDGLLLGGPVLEQDDRDVEITNATLRADYALSPSTAFFVSTTHNWRNHDLAPVNPALNRDSEGQEYLAGVRFDLTDLLIGEIGVGQFSQEYDAPGTTDTNSGTVRAQVEWYPDELLTITLAANRNAGDSGVVGSAGFVSDRISARVDYEFRRNIIFGLGVMNIEDDYVGINRSDSRRNYDVSADYIVSRQWSAFVSFARFSQESSGDLATLGREYDIDQVTIGVRLRR
jgi:hypothetical protein